MFNIIGEHPSQNPCPFVPCTDEQKDVWNQGDLIDVNYIESDDDWDASELDIIDRMMTGK